MLTTHAHEPEAGPWRVAAFDDLVRDVLALCGDSARPVVAVDGRSAGGKSTISARLAAAIPGAEVVHTDDVAWWHDCFAWEDLLISGVLTPYLAGEAVSFRPPAWQERSREGAIAVSGDARLLIVEGVGASRSALAPYLDAALWVQSDWVLAEQRGIARDMLTERPDAAEAKRFWDEWEEQERPFLAADKPWERADLIVCGTPQVLPAGEHLSGEQILIGRRLSD